jgi:hypothetical protein
MDLEILGRTPGGFERRLAESADYSEPITTGLYPQAIKVEPTRHGFRVIINVKKLPKELATLVVSWDE